jgi:hypothetical protein
MFDGTIFAQTMLVPFLRPKLVPPQIRFAPQIRPRCPPVNRPYVPSGRSWGTSGFNFGVSGFGVAWFWVCLGGLFGDGQADSGCSGVFAQVVEGAQVDAGCRGGGLRRLCVQQGGGQAGRVADGGPVGAEQGPDDPRGQVQVPAHPGGEHMVGEVELAVVAAGPPASPPRFW